MTRSTRSSKAIVRQGVADGEEGPRRVYVASKTKHAPLWRLLRQQGLPIISTWIDEAGPGESADLSDLWRRCVSESAEATALILYREPGEILKGAWVEMGAALAHGVPVFAVGIEEFSVSRSAGVLNFEKLSEIVEHLFGASYVPPRPIARTEET